MNVPNLPDRREFLARTASRSMLTAAALSGATAAVSGLLPNSAAANAQTPARPPRIAFLGTVVRKHSHAQHFLDRMTLGYTWGGQWQSPRIEVASVYVDQHPEGDLTDDRVQRHQLKLFPTIEEALTLGSDKLAVDGVVIIAEHGDYPKNEKGQTRYPRYEWFRKVVRVFEDSGRSVPVFSDKHLSTVWDECTDMVATSKRLNFPFLAGSSLPVTWRLPSVDVPFNADLTESVCVAYGGIDSYDIHALETAQCMSERRRGGEVGVREVHALKGDRLWQRLMQDDCRVTRQLIVSALTRSHSLPVKDGFPTQAVSFDWLKATLPQTTGYLVTHRDGFRTTMLLTGIHDFNYAGRLKDGSTVSCQMYLPMPGQGATTADFFNPLTRHVESMLLTGTAPYPVERTLLTSGIVIAGVDSLFQNESPVATPGLEVRYSAPQQSTFWRE